MSGARAADDGRTTHQRLTDAMEDSTRNKFWLERWAEQVATVTGERPDNVWRRWRAQALDVVRAERRAEQPRHSGGLDAEDIAEAERRMLAIAQQEASASGTQ